MRKGAARNMQRISLKVVAGTAPPQNHDVQQAPVHKQMRALELRRLARVRYSFEIEQQIAEMMAAGQSVGLLREKLLAVRNGTIEPPHYKSVRPTGDRMRLRKSNANGAEAQKQRDDRRWDSQKRLYRSEREVESDLADLAKGKLTPTGIGTIKGMLERFDEGLVLAVLGLKLDFIQKVSASAVYRLAPDLSPRDGLLLSEVLESRLPADGHVEPKPAASLPAKENGSASAAEDLPRDAASATNSGIGAVSVNAISGSEYLNLRSKGWSISGAWMYPPAGTTPPPLPEASRRAPEPRPKTRTAVSPTKAKLAKTSKKAKRRKKGSDEKGRLYVPLSAEALKRLHSSAAFQPAPMTTPRKPGTLTLPVDRPGFVIPPASKEINWRDESEDGSMWDR